MNHSSRSGIVDSGNPLQAAAAMTHSSQPETADTGTLYLAIRNQSDVENFNGI